MTTTLTLGLAVTGTHMSERDAKAFVQDTITAVGVTPDTVHGGVGVWEGQREGSVILTWFDLPTLDAVKRGSIARVARTYGQDAVALMEAPVAFL